MKKLFNIGDTQVYEKEVTLADCAAFQGEVLHPVCATFALARDIEWTSRLFVLEMKAENEEGIGTMLTIQHRSPAKVGETMRISATVESIQAHELICTYIVNVGSRLVATGKTGQKIMSKEKLKRLLA